jgi:hypothetical protein
MHGCPAGGLAPSSEEEEEEVKGKPFLEVSDVAVKRIHADKGQGTRAVSASRTPLCFMHWSSPVLHLAVFFFWRPMGGNWWIVVVPWLTFVHKLAISTGGIA